MSLKGFIEVKQYVDHEDPRKTSIQVSHIVRFFEKDDGECYIVTTEVGSGEGYDCINVIETYETIKDRIAKVVK